MFCYNCGHKIEDGARFCEKCGMPVTEAPAGAAPTAEYAEQQAGSNVPPTAQYVPPQYIPPEPAREGSKVFGILSLIGGIFSIIFCWVPILMFVPEILTVVFGILGLVKRSGKGMALAGLILGIISFVLSVAITLALIVLLISEGTVFDSAYYFSY